MLMGVFGKYGRRNVDTAAIKMSGTVRAERDHDIDDTVILVARVRVKDHKFSRDDKLGMVKTIFTVTEVAATAPEGMTVAIDQYLSDVDERRKADVAGSQDDGEG